MRQDGLSTWRGTDSALFAVLQPLVSPEEDEFPAQPHHLPGELRWLSPILRQPGVHLRFDEREGHNRERILSIQFAELDADACLQANSKLNEEEDDSDISLEKPCNSASASVRDGWYSRKGHV